MAINTGVNVSKLVGYASLWPTDVSPPSWPTFTFGNGVIGVGYSQQFTPLGAASVSVAVQSGSLPSGLSLNNVSGSTWKINGTPSALGSFSFTLRASNTYGTADASFSMDVVSPSAGGFHVLRGSVVS